MARPHARRRTQRQIFLRALAYGASVTEAGAQSGLPISTLYHWRQHDARFRAAWDRAAHAGAELMAERRDDEMMRRAVASVERPVTYRGKAVGTRTRYSDAALMLAIRELRARQEMRRQIAPDDVAPGSGVRVIVDPQIDDDEE